ncbi:MAG: SDR family NAD(P)-dependent oxidoreductase [Acidimicrobiia bacterium]
MGRLDGKAAVVVGGGQTPGETIGNGRATAIAFAREGAEVLVVDRHLERAADTCAAIAAEGGVAHPFAADITDEEQAAALVAAAVERFGRIDVLHNNVGIGAGDATATKVSAAGLQRIFEVNLFGLALTCKHALPVMREAGRGSIINISSVAAVLPFGLVGYKTSKAAVNAYTESLAAANARYGVRVNAIMPGLMETPMAIDASLAARGGISREALVDQRNRQVPLGRKMGTGWDVAWAAVYLASDEARFVTGVVLPVDGGQSVAG